MNALILELFEFLVVDDERERDEAKCTFSLKLNQGVHYIYSQGNLMSLPDGESRLLRNNRNLMITFCKEET
ncbi:CLUMA_CG000704, isoform A [Clunio marinus]|uniref:CLUMA_CG000704, isoform A n=1 Tax=Clunio marinus TaxID=568069 RepID=A0A1J1HFX4_9DIPT|nr:CLUMA_CG000704, isoform A [Clunio marinus]